MDVTTEQDAFKKMQAKYEMEIQEERQIFKHMSSEMEKLKIENEVNLCFSVLCFFSEFFCFYAYVQTLIGSLLHFQL